MKMLIRKLRGKIGEGSLGSFGGDSKVVKSFLLSRCVVYVRK